MVGNGNREKAPLQSKKFIAFLIAELTWKALAVFTLVWAWGAEQLEIRVFLLLLSIVVVSAFVEIGYVLGQASLDKFVRLAEITGKVVTKTSVQPQESPKKETTQ